MGIGNPRCGGANGRAGARLGDGMIARILWEWNVRQCRRAVRSMVLASETCLDEELVASIVALSICLAAVMLPWLPRLTAMLLNDRASSKTGKPLPGPRIFILGLFLVSR